MKSFPGITAVLIVAGLVAEGCGTLQKLIPGLGPTGTQVQHPLPVSADMPVTHDTLATSYTIGNPTEITMPDYEELKLTALQRRLIKTAKGKVGCRYQYAAKGPNTFDCSGFTGYVFGREGIRLSPSSMARRTMG